MSLEATHLRYDRAALEAFGAALFRAAGFTAEAADITGRLLVEADAMGHDTHGLAQAPGYLQAVTDGQLVPQGEPLVVRDKGATLVWDGGKDDAETCRRAGPEGAYLPGLWLTWRAIQTAIERVAQFGTVSIAIRRSHHIGCLAAFLPLITERGYLGLLLSSDPAVQAVAPFGSVEPVYTPNPIACGIPTGGDPILIDVSASGTTIGLAGRALALGEEMAGPWLVAPDGQATADPTRIAGGPGGALLPLAGALWPLGGPDRGHKGFGLGLMIEAMTSGLAGFGRLQGPTHQGASVFLQLLDPDAFGGGEAFRAETQHLVEACRGARVPAGRPPVRLPGERALARKRQAAADGVPLHPSILPGIRPWAARYGVAEPAAMA